MLANVSTAAMTRLSFVLAVLCVTYGETITAGQWAIHGIDAELGRYEGTLDLRLDEDGALAAIRLVQLQDGLHTDGRAEADAVRERRTPRSRHTAPARHRLPTFARAKNILCKMPVQHDFIGEENAAAFADLVEEEIKGHSEPCGS